MTSGSLTDLDPSPAPERRWPFYVAWTVGGLIVGAVLFAQLPASVFPPSAPFAVPQAPAPVVTKTRALVQVVIPIAPAPLRAPSVPAPTRR